MDRNTDPKDVVNFQQFEDTLRLALAHRDWLSVEEREKLIGEVKNAIGNNSDELTLHEDIHDNGEVSHTFDVGDYALDSKEPTPSPEANTVEIIELKDARANEYLIEETGKTVAEHNPYSPGEDPVVVGVYPNMDSDKKWHFPESRLDPV
jgi:hypothetical protein